MPKIQDKFKELKSKNEKALISYIMTGFPNEHTTLSIVRGLVNGGTDILDERLGIFESYYEAPYLYSPLSSAYFPSKCFLWSVRYVRV